MGPTIPIGNHGHAGREGGYEREAAAHDDEAYGSVADSVEEDGADCPIISAIIFLIGVSWE